MKKIHKFPIEITDTQSISIECQSGTFSKIVYVGLDGNKTPCIWVEFIPGTIRDTYDLKMFGTGEAIPEYYEHIGTFMQGSYLWHLYI